MHRRPARGVRARACARQQRPRRGRVPAQRPVRPAQDPDERLGRVRRLTDCAATNFAPPEPGQRSSGCPATADTGNKRSWRVLERAGLGRQERMAGHRPIRGAQANWYLCAIRRYWFTSRYVGPRLRPPYTRDTYPAKVAARGGATLPPFERSTARRGGGHNRCAAANRRCCAELTVE